MERIMEVNVGKWKFIKRGIDYGIYVLKNGNPHVVIREGYNAVSALLDGVRGESKQKPVSDNPKKHEFDLSKDKCPLLKVCAACDLAMVESSHATQLKDLMHELNELKGVHRRLKTAHLKQDKELTVLRKKWVSDKKEEDSSKRAEAMEDSRPNLKEVIEKFDEEMFDEIVEDINERMSRHCNSRCASPDEVRIIWLVSEVQELKKENQELKKENQELKKENQELKKENDIAKAVEKLRTGRPVE
jgi:regulator of replication initiation timing